MQNTIRLGQRVYGVSTVGTIIPTLISKAELTYQDSKKYESNGPFEGDLEDPLHGDIFQIKYGVLNHTLINLWITFDKAYEHALIILTRLKESDQVTIRQQREYEDRYQDLLANKDTAKETAASVDLFSESCDLLGILPDIDQEKHLYSQNDFPQCYIELGTPVWISDTNKWLLIQGFVTKVQFYPMRKDKVLYTCGSHSHLDSGRVFKTKRGAMNCLEQEFAQKLPGTLNRRKVPVVQQFSEADEAEKKLK